MITPFQYLNRSLQVILLINLGIFILCFLGKLSSFPVENLLIFSLPNVLGFEVWRIVTYMFTHVDPLHFLFNMLMLWMFGAEVAEIMGTKKFTLFYLGTGVFAILASCWLHPFVLGASGALCAVMYAYAQYFPERQILLFFLFPMQMRYAIYVFIALDLMFVAGGDQRAVAYGTHIGGFIAAIIYFQWLDRKRFGGPSSMERWLASVQKSTPKTSRVHQVDFTPAQNSEESPIVEHIIAEERLDEILAKVSKSGLASLSEEEKDILLLASKTRQIRSGKAKENDL